MGRTTCRIGTCPDCDEENVKITSAGVCMKCYKRMHNCKSRGKEYVPYNQAEPSNRGKKRVSSKTESVTKEIIIKKEQVEDNEEKDRIIIDDPDLYCLVDLKMKAKKLQDPIDIETIYNQICDMSNVVDIIKDSIGVKAIDRSNSINNLINETLNIYKHRLEAAYDTPQEKEMFEKYKALDKVRRKFKRYTGAVLVLNNTLNNPANRKVFMDTIDYMAIVLDAYYSGYDTKKSQYLEEDITNDNIFQETIRPTAKKSYRVDITTDKINDRHFIQDRWAFNEEDAINKVKQFIRSHRYNFTYADKDIVVTELTQDNEYNDSIETE